MIFRQTNCPQKVIGANFAYSHESRHILSHIFYDVISHYKIQNRKEEFLAKSHCYLSQPPHVLTFIPSAQSISGKQGCGDSILRVFQQVLTFITR